jgi:hypothetical protein
MKFEMLEELKSYTLNMKYWASELYFIESEDHDYLTWMVTKGIEERVINTFNNTRNIKLHLDTSEIITNKDNTLELSEDIADFFVRSLGHNKEVLDVLQKNIKDFIKIIEQEKIDFLKKHW